MENKLVIFSYEESSEYPMAEEDVEKAETKLNKHLSNGYKAILMPYRIKFVQCVEPVTENNK